MKNVKSFPDCGQSTGDIMWRACYELMVLTTEDKVDLKSLILHRSFFTYTYTKTPLTCSCKCTKYHKIHALLNNLLILAVKAVQYNYEDKTHVTNKSPVSVPMYLNISQLSGFVQEYKLIASINNTLTTAHFKTYLFHEGSATMYNDAKVTPENASQLLADNTFQTSTYMLFYSMDPRVNTL